MNSPTLTALVAEDEATLREELIEQLNQLWPELQIVGPARDGLEALRLFDELRPDIVFLDIEMPGATGLEVARQIGQRAHIVFVTAYDQFAIEAFEQGVVDYLLKPLSPARLFTAISRLKQRLATPPADISPVLARLQERGGEAIKPQLRWINASIGQTLRLITVDEVCYFQSDNKYTRVVTRDSEALIRKPLKELTEELDAQQFWQIHRSTLVNVSAISGLTRDFRGRLQVKLKDRSDTLLVAESYAHLFKQM
ncbi:LytTR family DNA-binding domain-containing protein [Paucibacter sp. APW11]|uniref:LytTR family DNA-binding domain-containing protein n=1 Tax=Roseateles aquae TaxID=3077235 RepID=A0ABU3PDM7_9BURK|nr:LytTR family DNA-binding domain-containing protein [Paucibacter sp. APW11]MDT9000690.1 LytTR family DNA-binding domain-containing protein [Paucibacter sp. APW11]